MPGERETSETGFREEMPMAVVLRAGEEGTWTMRT